MGKRHLSWDGVLGTWEVVGLLTVIEDPRVEGEDLFTYYKRVLRLQETQSLRQLVRS